MARAGKNFHFSGKLGNLVGVESNGVFYLRKAPEWRGAYKPTEKQIANQKKFKFAMLQMRNFRELFDLTIEKERGQTKNSSAVRSLLRNAIVGEHPSFSIDYSRLMVARGSLTPPQDAAAASLEPGTISYTWTHEEKPKNFDEHGHLAMLIAYYPLTEDFIYYLHGPRRSENKAELRFDVLKGLKVHTWLAFRSRNMQYMSDSIYTGEIQVMD